MVIQIHHIHMSRIVKPYLQSTCVMKYMYYSKTGIQMRDYDPLTLQQAAWHSIYIALKKFTNTSTSRKSVLSIKFKSQYLENHTVWAVEIVVSFMLYGI